MSDTPSVSVIVPVHGDRGGLANTLRALEAQDYAGRIETIVVDNGDNGELPVERDGLTVIREERPGSYAARNAGVRRASGAILAFTDADCRPQPSWLSRGVAAVQAGSEARFVGGHIEVRLDAREAVTAAGLWDLLHGLEQEKYVTRDGFAATANMFVARKTFDLVGPFDASLMSGGDREWSERATAAGVEAVYAPDAVVLHPARTSLAEVQRKISRITHGWADVEVSRGSATVSPRVLARRILPHSRSILRASRRLGDRGFSRGHQLRYFVLAHWLQYFSLAAWLGAAARVRRDASSGAPTPLGDVWRRRA